LPTLAAVTGTLWLGEPSKPSSCCRFGAIRILPDPVRVADDVASDGHALFRADLGAETGDAEIG
jgi:hypothetical protein